MANSGSGTPQLTLRAVILAVVLAMILSAANAYLGLFAGLDGQHDFGGQLVVATNIGVHNRDPLLLADGVVELRGRVGYGFSQRAGTAGVPEVDGDAFLGQRYGRQRQQEYNR